MEGDPATIFEALLHSSPDAVVAVDADGVIQTASPAVTRLFGYKPDELVGRPVEVLIPERFWESHVRNRQNYSQEPKARPMGVSVDLRGCRSDGSVFPVDVSLAPAFVDGRLYIGAFVRDAGQRRRTETLLRHVNDISRLVLAGTSSSELFAVTAERARSLLAAVTSWVALAVQGEDHLIVSAASGRGAEVLLDAKVAVKTSIAASAMERGSPSLVDDMSRDPDVLQEATTIGLGPGLYLPMLADDGPVGALVVARGSGEPLFDKAEISAAETFASAAAVVLALGQAREYVEELKMMAEHERIARDLHDTVIQRLFALGMGLQAAESLADGGVRERIGAAVEAVDEVIREIRETIFDLGHPAAVGSQVHQEVKAVMNEARQQLGFAPRLAFRGPVEVEVSDALLPHVLAVVRESLANVARHASASSVDVVIQVGSGTVDVLVSDDGTGFADSGVLGAGHGLQNMRSRAEQLGGELTLSSRNPSGTLLRWKVPARP